MKQVKRQIDILDGYLSLEKTRNDTLNQMAFYEYDNPKYRLLDKKLDKIDNDLDVQAKQGAKVFGSMSNFLDILNEYSEHKTAVKTRLLKNPTNSQVTRCRKVLAESERETHKPTISHYRDMKNGNTKTKNPSFEKIALVKLRDKFKLKSPRPFEQLTANDKYLIAKYPQYFEVDNGYVYLMKKVRRNPTTATVKRASNPSKLTEIFVRKQIAKYNEQFNESYALRKTNGYYELFDGVSRLADVGGLEVVYRQFLREMKKHGYRLELQKRKPNHSNTDFNSFVQATTRKNSRMFQGKLTGEQTQLTAPNGTPKNLSRLGELKLMIVKMPNGEKANITFDKNAYLAMDIRKNLHCIGNGAKINGIKIKGNGLAELGRLIQIDYVTDKKHINGNKLTHFYHKLGEVTGETPRLFVDTERFPIIHGGNYDVWSQGIVN